MHDIESGRAKVLIIAGVVALLAIVYSLFIKSSGEQRVQASESAMFLCSDSRSVTAIWPPGKEGEVVLRLSHGPKAYLSQSVSASGAKYISQDQRITFWSKGSEATVTENGVVTYSGCVILEFSQE